MEDFKSGPELTDLWDNRDKMKDLEERVKTKKYSVRVDVTESYQVTIEAKSAEEAERKVEDMEISELTPIDSRTEFFAIETEPKK